MKGSYYGLSSKQLILFFAAVALTIILVTGWAKAPMISSLIPSQGGVLKLFPVVTDEGKETEASRRVNGSDRVSWSVNIVAPVSSPSTLSYNAAIEKGNSPSVYGKSQETITRHKEDSGVKQFSEGEKGSKLAAQDSVAPLSSVTANSSPRGSVEDTEGDAAGASCSIDTVGAEHEDEDHG